MSNNIVYQPTVYNIASTVIWTDELKRFFEAEGVDYEDPNTPAWRIISQAESDYRVGQVGLLAEIAGRRCYDSYSAGRTSALYHDNIINEAHGSIYAHGAYTFAICGVSRSLTHELARHQIGIGFSQQSQRYVKADDINIVMPPLLIAAGATAEGKALQEEWAESNIAQIKLYEKHRLAYEQMLKAQWPNMSPRMRKKRAAEAARSLLPNAAETRLIWTPNMRAARHVLQMRGSQFADLEIGRLFVEVIFPFYEKHEADVIQDFSYSPVEDDIIKRELHSLVGGI